MQPDDRDGRTSAEVVAWYNHGWTQTLVGVIVALLIAWWGVNDFRLPGAYRPPTEGTGGQSSAPVASASPSGQVLSGSSPVRVTWLGSGEALEVSWEAIEDPELESYSLNVYGLSPEQTWYNVGYREDTRLATTRVIYPLAETRVRYEETDKQSNVGPGETWRVCVHGMRKTPGGVDITPYIIEGSRRCSDEFTIPAPQ